MDPENISALSAIVRDALEELRGETSAAAVFARGRLHAACRLLRHVDHQAAAVLQQEMDLCDSYRHLSEEELPF